MDERPPIWGLSVTIRRGNVHGGANAQNGQQVRCTGRRLRTRWPLFQEFDGLSLKPFLTLADLHPHTLAFSQPAQPAASKCRGVNKQILSPVILTDETESLVGLVDFYGPKTFLRLA